MSGIRPSGLHVNKPVVFAVIITFVLLLLAYRYLFVDHNLLMSKDSGTNVNEWEGKQLVWVANEMADPPILDNASKEKLDRKSEMFDIDVSGTTVPIYVQQVISAEQKGLGDVLFLHGARFSSENWQNITALDQVANWGFRAIAIDLPGKGKSRQKLDASLTTLFLPALVKRLEMTRPVIIAPSMSGQYALPYLFDQPEKGVERALGFVPIAPVGTEAYVNAYPASQVPSLIVYGAKDPSGRRVLMDLHSLPGSVVALIMNAGHACYLDQPVIFFKYLYTFLDMLTNPR